MGIARRLLQELHHDVEGLVGVMNDEILFADRRAAVPGMLAAALRMAGRAVREFGVGAIEARQLRQLVKGQHAIDEKYLVVRAGKRALHEEAQLDRHRGLKLKANDRTAPAALEHRLEFAHQILGFFLDLNLGITDDTERALPAHGVPREKAPDEKTH